MIFEARNCQEFISEELARRMKKNPHYSLRAFAKHLGLSAGELSELIRGKRKLSIKSCMKIAKALSFTVAETQQLFQLANQEKIASEEGDLKFQSQSRHLLNLDLFSMIADWYCMAILNLIGLDSFQNSEAWMAKRLGISPLQVRHALERLMRLGLVEKQGKTLKLTHQNTFTPEDIPSQAIREHHRQMLGLASSALDDQPPQEREISGVGFSMRKKDLPKIKKEISEFLDLMAEKYGNLSTAEEVYQLEMALFKLTKTLVSSGSNV